MRRRRHEERVFGILGFIQGERAIQPERAVPRASRFIDGIIEVDKPGDGWGPLDPLVTNRVVLVEHYSRAPGITAYVRAVAKLAHVVDEWWRDLDANHRKIALATASTTAAAAASTQSKKPAPHTDAPCPPMLLILSADRPRQVLAGLRPPPICPTGIWHASRTVLGDVTLVHVRGLPQRHPGVSVLRLMATPRTRAEAMTLLDALLADPDVLQSTKEDLLEELMSGAIQSTPTEHQTIIAQIRSEGHQEGRQEGRQETRNVLLRLARYRLDDAAISELESISDLADLEARLVELLGTP